MSPRATESPRLRASQPRLRFERRDDRHRRFRLELLDDRSGVVRRRIIDNDEFPVGGRPELRNRGEAFFEIRPGCESR